MSVKQLHKQWRKEFNEYCLKRDKYKCVFCNNIKDLDVHHIQNRHELPAGGYVIENGITLCKKHHLEAEQYHISDKKIGIKGMYPDDLYILIGSSYELAVKKSEELKA